MFKALTNSLSLMVKSSECDEKNATKASYRVSYYIALA
jgi:hypothetical protein